MTSESTTTSSSTTMIVKELKTFNDDKGISHIQIWIKFHLEFQTNKI